MKRWFTCAYASTVLALAGCQAHPLGDAVWAPPRPLHADLPAYQASTDPPQSSPEAQASAPAPTGELSLRQALAAALLRHPQLHGQSWAVRRAEALALQAGRWPNPELEIELENFGGNDVFHGASALETTVSLAQTIPLGGDLALQRAAGHHAGVLAGWDFEAARLAVLTETTQRYLAVLAAQARLEVTREGLELAQQIAQTTRKRVDAGDAPPLELTRASVPVALAEVAQRQAQRSLVLARSQLARCWGATEPGYDHVTGQLEELASPPELDQLIALINQNPQVARWATEISLRQTEVQLARAQALPDVTARLGYRYDRADNAGALVAGLSLPLPLLDQRQDDIRAARLGAAAAEQHRQAAQLQLASLLADAYTRLANAHDEASALGQTALPAGREAFAVTRRAFEQGDLAFLDVLDAERTLVELRVAHLDALVAYHQAAAEIEGLIGQSLASLSTAPAPAAAQGDSQP